MKNITVGELLIVLLVVAILLLLAYTRLVVEPQLDILIYGN